MGEDQGFYKLSDLVTEALEFRNNIASRLGCSYDWIENINEIVRLQKNNEELDRLLYLLGNPDDAIAEIERLQNVGAESSEFRRDVKQHLIDLVGKDLSDQEAIKEIKRLQKVCANAQDKSELQDLKVFRDTICGYLNIEPTKTWQDTSQASSKIAFLTQFKECHDRDIRELDLDRFHEIDQLQISNEKSCIFRQNVKKILIELADNNGCNLNEITDEQAVFKIQQLASTFNDFEYAQYKSSFQSLKQMYFIIAELLGVNNDDDEIIAKIKGLQEFSINAKKALPENGALSDDAFIDSVYELRSERTYYRSILDHLCNRLELHSADAFERLKQVEVRELKSDELEKESLKFEIERLKRCMSGIASFLDLPSDAKQPDICQAIMELKEKYKKVGREPLSNEQIIIADLHHDLAVAKKVIARLVGE